jgi:hypothetical protein
LPVGLVWGEGPAEVLFHPDEAVTGVIAAVFERFAACGSARAVWLWLREQGLKWPLIPMAYLHGTDIRWVEPAYRRWRRSPRRAADPLERRRDQRTVGSAQTGPAQDPHR